MTDGLAVHSELGGRYVLGQPLGTGGMADVYRAHDTVLDRPVAVKLFRLDETAAATLARSRNEIALAAGLQHHGLVAVYDTGADPVDGDCARPYLVMELVDGCTLRAAIAAGSLSRDDVASIGRQAGEALEYLHRRGIVHRDVKPANVLMRRDPRGHPEVKITDFGVARSLNGAPLTETGTTVGTPNYLSPEQVSGASVTGAADVYALGLVLLECLTGDVAFPGTGVEAALSRLHRDPFIPAGLGADWVRLLTAMTDREAARRPTAGQVAVELGAPARDVVFAPPPAPPDEAHTAVLPVAGRERRTSRGALALAAMVAAAAAVVGVGVATAGNTSSGVPVAPPPTTAAAPVHTFAPPTTPAAHRVAVTHTPTKAAAPPPAPRPAGHHRKKDH